MNKHIYNIEIKMDNIRKETSTLRTLLLVGNIEENSNVKLFKRMFENLDIENIHEHNLKEKLEVIIEKYDFIISSPYHLQDILITDVINIGDNKKHIILLNNKVTQYDILSMNKKGNALFLGNNLEAEENIDIFKNYIDIILKQREIQLYYREKNKNKQDDITKREKIIIYNNVVVVQNILKKVFKEIEVSETRCIYTMDEKNFYLNLNKYNDNIKIIVLNTDNPPIDIIKMITKLSSKIKIIYITNTKDKTMLDELVKIGVDDFIYKPFEIKNIIEKLRIADDVERKAEKKIKLYSLKELVEVFNKYINETNIDKRTKDIFKNYFKKLQH